MLARLASTVDCLKCMRVWLMGMTKLSCRLGILERESSCIDKSGLWKGNVIYCMMRFQKQKIHQRQNVQWALKPKCWHEGLKFVCEALAGPEIFDFNAGFFFLHLFPFFLCVSMRARARGVWGVALIVPITVIKHESIAVCSLIQPADPWASMFWWSPHV